MLAQTPPSYPTQEQLDLIARESIVLFTIVIGLFGVFIIVKWGLIPLGKVFAEATSGMAQATKNLHDSIRDNLLLAERLHDLDRNRKES